MAARTSWKGFLRLSLVSVPVKAFTANNTEEDVRLNQLHDECHGRVRYKKVCPEHGELKNGEIVSGYEYAKDSYVVIDPAELQKLRAQSDKSVNIDGFVKPEEIDPIYFAGKTYYLLPDGVAGQRPYSLLIKGMGDAGLYAIAQIVLAGREQLVLLRPVEDMLVMSVLNYPKRIKAMDEFKDGVPNPEVTKEELALTQTLIGASTLKSFDLATYKDDYVENLSKLIELKIEGREVVQAPDHEEPKIINLMDALKKSVAEAQKKMAPSVKEPASRAEKKAPRKKKTG